MSSRSLPVEAPELPRGERQRLTEAAAACSSQLRELIEQRHGVLLAIARRVFGSRRRGTVSPTVLVQEVFLRFVDRPQLAAGGELFFLACFARQCRRVLIEHFRRRAAERRGGGRVHCTLEPEFGFRANAPVTIVEVDDVVDALARFDSRLADIVDLHVFGGLTMPQCAEVLSISLRTAEKQWHFARAWLQRALR
jgi:RNA polymerase sigma factor (TIGR02999 family)